VRSIWSLAAESQAALSPADDDEQKGLLGGTPMPGACLLGADSSQLRVSLLTGRTQPRLRRSDGPLLDTPGRSWSVVKEPLAQEAPVSPNVAAAAP